jgi:putative ABC transport system permease protein
VIGVVLSLTLILVSWGMIDTIQHLMNRQFVEIQLEDASVYFTAPIGATEASALESVDGIAQAEPVLELPVSFAAGDRHYDTSLVAMEPDTSMHAFYGSGGNWIDLPSKGLLAGSALEDLLQIKVGDAVHVTVAGLGVTIDTTVAGFVDEPLGTMSYISRDQAETLAGMPLPATSALVRYEPGADAATIRAAVTELPQVAAFEDANAIYDVMQNLMVLFYAFVGVMLVFGAAMAFALIFNAMSVNISERSREMATLLALGTRRRTISQFITAENMLVAFLGIPIGLVAGYYMSKAAMGTFSSDLFAFDLSMRPTTFVFASLAIAVVALLSQVPGLRAVRRIDIARYIKERSA